MTDNNITSFAQEAFKARLSKMAAAGKVDDGAFADAVYTAVSQFGIDENMFRDAFGLSKGAVERWTLRQNLPQPGVRPKILLWIMERVTGIEPA